MARDRCPDRRMTARAGAVTRSMPGLACSSDPISVVGMTELAIAAIQMAMTHDFDDNIATAERLVRDAARQGARIILIPELFEGPYFCKDQLPEHLALARRLDGHPTVEHFAAVAAELGVVLPLSLYERVRPGAVQLGRGRRCRRLGARHLPQEPHSRRAGLHREVLLLAGRHRVPGVGHGARHDRCRHLLGPVVPRVGPLHGAARRRGAPLSDRDRERAARPVVGLVGALAAGDAGARRSEPDAARGGEPCRPRDRPDLRDHVLRLVVHRRRHRREGRRGRPRRRGGAGGALRPRAAGRAAGRVGSVP